MQGYGIGTPTPKGVCVKPPYICKSGVVSPTPFDSYNNLTVYTLFFGLFVSTLEKGKEEEKPLVRRTSPVYNTRQKLCLH